MARWRHIACFHLHFLRDEEDVRWWSSGVSPRHILSAGATLSWSDDTSPGTGPDNPDNPHISSRDQAGGEDTQERTQPFTATNLELVLKC